MPPAAEPAEPPPDVSPLSTKDKGAGEVWSRSLLHAIHVFARDMSKASRSGVVNPLPYADEKTEGAFVAFNLNELSAGWASYLAGALMAHLHSKKEPVRSPDPVQYSGKKDPTRTPERWKLERKWAWDEDAQQHCAVYALSEGLKAYFDVELTREQCRDIFGGLECKGEERCIDMHQLKLALQPQLAPDGTLADLCETLLEPFDQVYRKERGTRRSALCRMAHLEWEDRNWRARLGPLVPAAHAARKALIKEQNAARDAGQKVVAHEDDADKPRSRSGARRPSAEKPSGERSVRVRTRGMGARAAAASDDDSDASGDSGDDSGDDGRAATAAIADDDAATDGETDGADAGESEVESQKPGAGEKDKGAAPQPKAAGPSPDAAKKKDSKTAFEAELDKVAPASAEEAAAK